MAFDPQGQAGTPGDDDLYEVLGLFPTATPDEVDAAYHRLLNGLITTVANTGEAAERLRRRRIRLAHAYAVLADPTQRAAYDARMGISAAPLGASAPPPVPMPPVSVPEVTPRPVPMPAIAVPETTPPSVPMPEVRPPPPAPPLLEPAVEEASAAAPQELLVEGSAAVAPEEPEADEADAAESMLGAETPAAVAEPEPEADQITSPLDEIRLKEPAPQPAALTEAEMAAGGVPAAAGAALPEDAPAPVVDEAPAPWQAPGVATRTLPPIKERPTPRRTPERRAPERPAPAAPGPRPAGGVALPSRKVAEATPLPAPRSRFTAAEDNAPLPRNRAAGAEDDDRETRSLGGRRAAPAAPERQRAPAPAPRRAKKAGRGNLLQILFYGSMAFILVVGTVAGFVSTIITTPTAAFTPVANTSTANAAGDAALQGGNYAEAIRQYNAALSSNGTDARALLGLAKAYFYKSPSEPDIAREYLARVFTAAGGTDTPEGQEALQLLSTIGLPASNATPGSPGAGTPGGTPGTGTTPGAGTPAGAPDTGATPAAGTPAPAVNTPGAVATPGTGTTAPAGTTGPAPTAPPGTAPSAPSAPGAPGPSTVAPAGTAVP